MVTKKIFNKPKMPTRTSAPRQFRRLQTENLFDKPKQVTFFTSNYDLCMDLALGEAGIPTNSAYRGRFSRVVTQQTFGNRVFSNGIGLGYRTEIPSANLVKIHGCSSWRNDGDRLTIDDSYEISKRSRHCLTHLANLVKASLRAGQAPQSRANRAQRTPAPKHLQIRDAENSSGDHI